MGDITGSTVYVLGAGASQHTGAPLLGAFLVKARLLLESEAKLKHRESFERVFRWIDSLRGSSYYVEVDLDNLEYVFSIAELGSQMSPDPPTNGSFPERVCTACSKPIPRDAPVAFDRTIAYHVRCWSKLESLESFALAEESRQALSRSRNARTPLRSAIVTRTCPACNEPLAEGESLLFRESRLVHTRCWRGTPEPGGSSPRALS